MSILNKKDIKCLLSDRLLFGSRASSFGERLVEGFKFLEVVKESQSDFNKNLFWYKYQDVFPHIAILRFAHFYDDGFIYDLQNHYFSVYKVSVVSQPLLSGNEIMRILNIKPSKQVGEIKERLMMGQLEGKIKTKEDAVKFIKNIKNIIL